MKRLIVFLLIICAASSPLFAQSGSGSVKTETFKVAGNCDMCKQRIEDAAYGKGVKTAEWNKSTGELTITYRTSKTDAATILRRVASAGHDADTFRAPEAAYGALPDCCSYKSNANQH